MPITGRRAPPHRRRRAAHHGRHRCRPAYHVAQRGVCVCAHRMHVCTAHVTCTCTCTCTCHMSHVTYQLCAACVMHTRCALHAHTACALHAHTACAHAHAEVNELLQGPANPNPNLTLTLTLTRSTRAATARTVTPPATSTLRATPARTSTASFTRPASATRPTRTTPIPTVIARPTGTLASRHTIRAKPSSRCVLSLHPPPVCAFTPRPRPYPNTPNPTRAHSISASTPVASTPQCCVPPQSPKAPAPRPAPPAGILRRHLWHRGLLPVHCR